MYLEISILNMQMEYFDFKVNFQFFKNGHFWMCDVEIYLDYFFTSNSPCSKTKVYSTLNSP